MCVIHALWVSGEITPGLRVFIMSLFQRALCSGVITIAMQSSGPMVHLRHIVVASSYFSVPYDSLQIRNFPLEQGSPWLCENSLCFAGCCPLSCGPLLLSPIERRSHWYGLSLTTSLRFTILAGSLKSLLFLSLGSRYTLSHLEESTFFGQQVLVLTWLLKAIGTQE